jgi:peptidoglycan/xylan/chitin deacetylase (PgdA/CDA1 family)
MSTRVVALTFHDIVSEAPGATPRGDSFYRVRASEMEALLGQLRQRGYRTVSSRAFRAWQRGTGTLPERTVVFTFDDGYASNLDVAAALLIRYRFSGTFFVTLDHIGQPGYLTWDGLRRLVFLGMEIGAHGVSHRPLTRISRKDLEHELVHAKRTLERQLGIPVQALAVPGGFWNGAVARAASAAGYDAVWVSTIGANGKETNPLALRRIVVRQPVAVGRIVSMVQGSQAAFWLAANQQLAIRVLKRVLGVQWYERLKRRLVPNA